MEIDKVVSEEILEKLRSLSDSQNVEGMARFGIRPRQALGISVTTLRQIAKEIAKDHGLALELWASGIHEARILATIIDLPEMVSGKQMENWSSDFDSWDICDQCCHNLFQFTKLAYQKAIKWTTRKEEFVKRAGFVLIACLAMSDKQAGDENFERFLPIMKREATDDRNYVKKAVSWALRQIGKRNERLNGQAIKTAEEILIIDSKSARWIALDALRDLSDPAVQQRLTRRSRLSL